MTGTETRSTRTGGPAGFCTVGRIAWALGCLAGLAVLLTLVDPGITSDEPLDVRPGRVYVATLRAKGLWFFDRPTVDAVFADNAEHPPLGRWLLGLASTLGEPFLIVLGWADPYQVYPGRIAPALTFATLVGLVAHSAGRRFGRSTGWVAGLSLLAMPRVFAHAHLAALDTFVCLFGTAALLRVDRAVGSPRPVRAMAGAGFWWGLALLVKIHGWLLPIIVFPWLLARLGSRRACAALAAWLAVGVATFWIGWPWLWYDSARRWSNYLATSTQRATIRVQYLGAIYADRDVPWHYPWLYFAVTVPIGLQALGVIGLARGWRDRRADPFPIVLTGAIGLFLCLFSTGIPVYDGERLFLVVFPFWSILIGLGFRSVWERARGPWSRLAVLVALAGQGYGVVALHPFGLSYYNALVGGLPGAEGLGLELTYWGDAVDPILLDRLAREARAGQVAALAPTLHHVQPAASLTSALVRRHVILDEQKAALSADWLVVYRRTSYWTPEIRERIHQGRPTAIRSRQGVWLSGLWRLPPRNSFRSN